MCGIWALFGVDVHSISKYDKTFSKIQHRGPDAWRLEYDLKVKVIIEKKLKYQNNILLKINDIYLFRISVLDSIVSRLLIAFTECNQ